MASGGGSDGSKLSGRREAGRGFDDGDGGLDRREAAEAEPKKKTSRDLISRAPSGSTFRNLLRRKFLKVPKKNQSSLANNVFLAKERQLLVRLARRSCRFSH